MNGMKISWSLILLIKKKKRTFSFQKPLPELCSTRTMKFPCLFDQEPQLPVRAAAEWCGADWRRFQVRLRPGFFAKKKTNRYKTGLIGIIRTASEGRILQPTSNSSFSNITSHYCVNVGLQTTSSFVRISARFDSHKPVPASVARLLSSPGGTLHRVGDVCCA